VIDARRALAAAVLLSATRTEAEPCVPRAALAGDAAAVASVAAELERLGVATERGVPSHRDARCRVVVAAVEVEHDGGIAVAVREGMHRSEGRIVSDPALAAAWIDSWLHDDFAIQAPEPGAEAVAPQPRPPDLVPMTLPSRSAWPRWAISASYDLDWMGNGEAWTGFGGGTCVRAGTFCFGVRGQYASGSVPTTSSAAQRTDFAALATASWQHAWGRMTISPELALGVGRMTTERANDCVKQPTMCDPSDPMCVMQTTTPGKCPSPQSGQPSPSDAVDNATITPRAAASLRVSVPLADHVWLDGLASMMFVTLGHPQAFATAAADPITGVDPLAVPGEPTAIWQLGIGLRVGVP
jgi:hypothetical protein